MKSSPVMGTLRFSRRLRLSRSLSDAALGTKRAIIRGHCFRTGSRARPLVLMSLSNSFTIVDSMELSRSKSDLKPDMTWMVVKCFHVRASLRPGIFDVEDIDYIIWLKQYKTFSFTLPCLPLRQRP